jgi:hypothetical protein
MNVYDLVSQIEWRFVLRTEEQLFFCAPRSVLVELSRKCDVFQGLVSVANYHVESQWRIVLSRKCDLFKDWFSVANYLLRSQCQTVIPFLFCVSGRGINPLSQYYFVSKRHLHHCWTGTLFCYYYNYFASLFCEYY